MERARLAWSQLPSSEEGELEGGGISSSKCNRHGVESLDYEVIENYAYREEQTMVPDIFSAKKC
ncbi:hypothetical protein DITRI_Ditri08aG0047900 [Diplodiscus trichospermus]